MERLPIDEVLPEVAAALRRAPNLVIVAPPGAGKTTRVPPALLEADLAGGREIVVLEPRRLAARLAAQRVAAERGEATGQTVGYQVRFERKVGDATRIRFVTEGVLTRQLVDDPALRRVGVIIADEVHERHLQGDLALALARRLQAGPRPDLRIVAMSATVDAGPLAAFLGDCPVIRSQGRMHPVDIEYLDQPDDWPLDKKVSGAVRRLVGDGLDGDVLVFLPGAAEIRRTAEACADVAARADLLLAPLHGDLPAADQDRAVARADRRKIILSTNVAESSVTIDGVVAVVDSGLARIPRHSPWSGIPSLRIEPVSRASCAQRAGRAGRTRPGRCLRLYSRHDHDTRREHEAPEILRLDLAEVALELHAAGVTRLDALAWPDPPPAAAVAAAEELLTRLGAVGAAGALTEVGRRMLRFPLHPRQARLLCEAEARGVAGEGCILAALAGERELRLERRGARAQARVSGPSDLLEDLDAFEEASADRLTAGSARAAGLDVGAAFAVDRARRQLERMIDRRGDRPRTGEQIDQALQMSILAGYPDRVARRRRPGQPEVSFAGGGGAALAPTSVVLEADLLVVTDAEERAGGRQAIARSATAIEPEWLLELAVDRVRDEELLEWNPAAERVEGVSRLAFDGLVLEESRDVERARRRPAEAAALLAAQARAAGLAAFLDVDALDAWRRRVRFAAAHAPELGIAAPDDAWIAAAIAGAAEGAVSFAELRKLPLLELVRGALGGDARRAVDRLAPEAIALPGRKRVPVHYEDDRPPWIASRMQDFFGLRDGPKVAGGRVPLVLHLLAPSQRPVQVTADLAGFWERHYPALRRELARRYPRHAWPERPAGGG